MTPNPGEHQLLLIRCPSCGQRFKVGEDLKGKTVECGACEGRFRVGDEVIMRGKRFYPGENKNPSLGNFPRVPISVEVESGGGGRYAPPPAPAAYEPATPERILAGITGVGGMLLAAFFLMFGSGYGGALSGMDTGKRLIVAGFIGFIGMALLVYANPRARVKAFLVGLVMAGSLVAIPMFFKKGTEMQETEAGPSAAALPTAAADTPADKWENLRAAGDLAPIDAANERLGKDGISWRVSSLWIHNLREKNRNQVRDYLIRTAAMPEAPIMYPRGEGDYLAVLGGVQVPMEKLRAIARELGSIKSEQPNLLLIEVEIDNDIFNEVPLEKLTEASSPAFYDLNKNELTGIDPDRIKRAVVRLAGAEPRLFRPDINRKLVDLMRMPGIDFKPEIARALSVWAETPGPAGEATLEEVKRLLAKGSPVSDDFLELLAKERTEGTVDVLVELWKDHPTKWEGFLGRFGNEAETRLLPLLAETKGHAMHSLVRVLGICGGPDSLRALANVRPGDDSELRVLLGRSQEHIRDRGFR